MNAVTRMVPLDLHAEELAMRARIRTKNYLVDTWNSMPNKGTIPKVPQEEYGIREPKEWM